MPGWPWARYFSQQLVQVLVGQLRDDDQLAVDAFDAVDRQQETDGGST